MTGYIIASSLLIGAVILLRALVRRAVSPRLVYALWLVVLLRLFIPVQPFTLTLPQRENQRPTLEHPLPETQTPLPENIPGTQESTSAPQREPFVPDEIAPPQNIPETTPPETSHVLTPTEPAQNKINFNTPR